MKKPKLAWLHPHFNNWMGGHEYIYQVVKRLKKNYDIKVFASTASPQAVKKFKSIAVDLETISNTSTYNPLYWFFLPYYLRKERGVLREKLKDFDVLISSYFPAGVWANRLGLKHIQICYEPLAFFYDENFLKGFSIPQRISFKILKFFYKNLDKKSLLESDKVLTLSHFNKNWIKKVYGRSDAIIIYDGVDYNFFKNTKTPKQNIILHSTDFTRIKGTDFLIEALPNIALSVPDIKVQVTSTLKNQKEKNRLINKAKSLGITEKLEFLGRVKYNQLPKLYSSAGVVIQPSIDQSMSLSVLEAMSCQTPVITGLEGWEQTKNNQAGFLVNSRNPEEIAAAAIKILTNKKLALKMGQSGRKIVKERFSWIKVASVISKTIKIS